MILPNLKVFSQTNYASTKHLPRNFFYPGILSWCLISPKITRTTFLTLSDNSFSTSFLILLSINGFNIMCKRDSWSEMDPRQTIHYINLTKKKKKRKKYHDHLSLNTFGIMIFLKDWNNLFPGRKPRDLNFPEHLPIVNWANAFCYHLLRLTRMTLSEFTFSMFQEHVINNRVLRQV